MELTKNQTVVFQDVDELLYLLDNNYGINYANENVIGQHNNECGGRGLDTVTGRLAMKKCQHTQSPPPPPPINQP